MKITNRRIGFTLTTITALLLLLFCLDLQDIEDLQRGEEASVSIGIAKRKVDDENQTGTEIPVTREEASSHSGFHVITLLSVFAGDIWPNYHKFSAAERDDRDAEVISALAQNLNNSEVKNIHLFYLKSHEMEAIMNLDISNKHKIIPVKVERLIHMADFFLYASKHLINQPVIAINSDIALGDGFEKIDTEKLRDNKIIYSLTRYGDKREKAARIVSCNPKTYKGSHDTHVFRLAEPLNETTLIRKLDYPTNMWQAENAMMFVMQTYFHFKVRNPCLVLKTYHRHLSKVHGPTDELKYTIRDLAPYNISTWDVFKSGYGFARVENRLQYQNPFLSQAV